MILIKLYADNAPGMMSYHQDFNKNKLNEVSYNKIKSEYFRTKPDLKSQKSVNSQYSIHQQELAGILAMKEKSNNVYIKGAMNLLKGAFKSEKEAYEFLFRNYYSAEEYEKQPLAKFTKDIVDEIGISFY